MKRAITALPLLLTCLGGGFAPGPAAAVELSFELYSFGLPVAQNSMTVDVGADTFRMGMRFRMVGVGSVFSGDRGEQLTTGVIRNGQAQPTEFRSNVRLHGKERHIVLNWRDGGPVPSVIDPPNATERDEVPMAQRAGTFDPLTAFVTMFTVASRTGRCDFSHQIYDGRRLEAFDVRTAGEEDLTANGRSSFVGRALRCDYVSRTVAGFLFGDGRAEDARPRTGTLWLAHPVPGGPLLPVRGEIDTRFLGRATMYLTNTTP